MALRATSLPFAEQNQFFRRKLNLPTNAWTDIYTREHDYAFVVAGANRDDLVQDFRQAVEKAIADGTTLEEFRRDFDRIVAKYGWSYRGGRNWRSRVIYETNMRSSYMAGRLEQLMAVREERPYWQYLHSDAVEHPRPKHESWNGLVLRWDDPWWQYHFPINAWGCQCSVRALSEDDLRRMGKDGPDEAPPIVWQARTIGQNSPDGPRVVEVPEGID
ncbi:phage head morphogenesis protein, partial [Pseudomonas aeruginosa]